MLFLILDYFSCWRLSSSLEVDQLFSLYSSEALSFAMVSLTWEAPRSSSELSYLLFGMIYKIVVSWKISWDSFLSLWRMLRTSLQVSIPHPRHHSPWTGALLPFLLVYFFIDGRLCINDVAQQCHIIALCLRPILSLKVSSYYSSSWIIRVNLELLSLVLWNKSHPSFLVGDYVHDLSYKSNAPVVWLETFHNAYS